MSHPILLAAPLDARNHKGPTELAGRLRMRIISNILESVRQLAVSWYTVDRIRIAPTTGRLLQLKTCDSIVLLNEPYTVLNRRIESPSDGPNHTDQLSYRLHYSGGERLLLVTRQSEIYHVRGELTIDNRAIEVFDCYVNFVTAEPHSPQSLPQL